MATGNRMHTRISFACISVEVRHPKAITSPDALCSGGGSELSCSRRDMPVPAVQSINGEQGHYY